MEIVLGIVGFIVGFFLWVLLVIGLFAVLPERRKAHKDGLLKSVGWTKILPYVAIPLLVFLLSAVYLTPFFLGTLPAGVLILFNVRKIADENRQKERARINWGK